jgi:hypothetical protein
MLLMLLMAVIPMLLKFFMVIVSLVLIKMIV